MNAVAFRSNLTRMLLDARQTEWDVEADDDVMDVYSETSPSPDEIRRRCGEIQKEWSIRERAKRAGMFGRQATWLPPRVSVGEWN